LGQLRGFIISGIRTCFKKWYGCIPRMTHNTGSVGSCNHFPINRAEAYIVWFSIDKDTIGIYVIVVGHTLSIGTVIIDIPSSCGDMYTPIFVDVMSLLIKEMLSLYVRAAVIPHVGANSPNTTILVCEENTYALAGGILITTTVTWSSSRLVSIRISTPVAEPASIRSSSLMKRSEKCVW